MTRPRARRDPPQRTGPIRNGAAAAALGAPGANGSGPSLAAALDQGLAAARLLAQSADTAVKGVVEQGVSTAYMVVEEYMRRGREAAKRHHERTNGSGKMSDKDRNEGEHGNAWGQGQVPPFLAPWMLAMRMWGDAMMAMVPGGPPMARAWMEQMMPGGSAWWGAGAPSRPRLSFEVTSRHPAEVSAALDPGAYYAKLSVNELTPGGETKAPSVKGVGIESSAGHVRISVTVLDDQPAGAYTGHIHDDTGARRGEVTLKLRAAARSASSKK